MKRTTALSALALTSALALASCTDAAEGTEASRLYLEQMIRHHEGAVDMARDEVNDGQNPEAVALAEDIIDAQESEIAEMEQLLQNL